MKIVRTLLVVLFCVIVATGCASALWEQFSTDLSTMLGHTQQELFDAFGLPDSKMDLHDGTTIYVWGQQRTEHYMTTLPETSTVFAYGQMATVTTPVPHLQTVEYRCTVKIAVKDNRITDYTYRGNISGCEPYINKLNRYLKAHGQANTGQSDARPQ